MVTVLGVLRGLRPAAAGAAALAVASCGGTTQVYSLDVPPTILTPASNASIKDARARFREIYCAVQADHGAAFPYDRPCANALHRLGFELPPSGITVDLGPARTPIHIVVIPGIFGECVESIARPFEDAIEPLRRLGYKVTPLSVSGRSSSAANARDIARQLAALPKEPGEKLLLIGYSKGSSDLIELIGGPDSAVIPAGSSVLSLAGVVAGTPIADGGERLYRRFWRIPFKACPPGDGGGVESLTRKHRLNYLAAHPLRSDLHYFSIAAFTDPANISSFLKSANAGLSKVDPRNDGNVIFHDAILPNSTLLGYVNSDHWALILPFSQKAPFKSKFFATRNEFPRVVLLESIARFVDEHYREGAAAKSVSQLPNNQGAKL